MTYDTTATASAKPPGEVVEEYLDVDGHRLDVTGLTTRQKVLRVALTLFAHKGYEATSLREIAAPLGFSKAALYYHFPSKESIVDEFLAQRAQLWEEFAQQAQGHSPSDIIDQLAALVRRERPDMLRLYMANGHLKTILRTRMAGPNFISGMLRLLAGENADAERLVRARLATWTVWSSVITLEAIDITDDERIDYAVAVAKDIVRDF